MIPFLVKLATLLDSRGQFKMAREVDDLIEKIAQITPPNNVWVQNTIENSKNILPNYNSALPQRRPDTAISTIPSVENLKSVLYKVMQMARVQSNEPSTDSKESANHMFAAIANTPEVAELPEPVKDQIKNLNGVLIDLKDGKKDADLSAAWSNVYGLAEKALTSILDAVKEQDVANKMPAQKKHRYLNDKFDDPGFKNVAKMQQAAGMTDRYIDGIFGPITMRSLVVLTDKNEGLSKLIHLKGKDPTKWTLTDVINATKMLKADPRLS